MRRALIVVVLVVLAASGSLAVLQGGAGHTATARSAVPAHTAATGQTAAARRTPSRLQAPTVLIPGGSGQTCFVGGTSCSLTPCTELIGSADAVAVTPSSGVYVPAPTTPRPTANCAKRPAPRSAAPATGSVTVVSAPSSARAAQAALPRLQQLLARKITLRAAPAPHR